MLLLRHGIRRRLLAAILGEWSMPFRTSLFSSWKAPGDAHGSYTSRVTHGSAGESGAASKPPPLNAAIFGNTWCLGERIHVRN